MGVSARIAWGFWPPSYYGGNGEELASIGFTLQHTDYKSVGAYRKFSGDHLKYQIIPSKVGKRMRGNDFMRSSLA